MALTKATVREILSSSGVDAEHMTTAVNQIIDGHVASIEALRDEISEQKKQIEDFRKEAGKVADLNKELKEANDKLAGMKDLEKKADDLQKLQKEFDDYKAEQVEKEQSTKRSNLLRDMLKEMKIESDEGINLGVKWYANKVQIDEDGKISNGKELRKEIREDLKPYISRTEEKGADSPNPPGNVGGAKMTKDEIYAIKNTSERQKAMLDNKELFDL